jgi:hypothetical protein
MQAAPTRDPGQRIFLLDQPFWLAESVRPEERWELALHEGEPEIERLPSAHRLDPEEAERKTAAKWKRIDRATVIAYAISDDPTFRRVGVVCGAGLGKTTNLEYLQAAINGLNYGFNKDFAHFFDLDELPDDCDTLLETMVKKIKTRTGFDDVTVRNALLRLLKAGRVTFLLDSLDQTDTAEALAALRELMQGIWGGNRVWVSGRPYAFRTAQSALQKMAGSLTWQFIRIGELDVPECRFLLEASKPRRES